MNQTLPEGCMASCSAAAPQLSTLSCAFAASNCPTLDECSRLRLAVSSDGCSESDAFVSVTLWPLLESAVSGAPCKRGASSDFQVAALGTEEEVSSGSGEVVLLMSVLTSSLISPPSSMDSSASRLSSSACGAANGEALAAWSSFVTGPPSPLPCAASSSSDGKARCISWIALALDKDVFRRGAAAACCGCFLHRERALEALHASGCGKPLPVLL
mmetsp:Transcript_69212/g.130465  ORF Transcript_69212/g.130465 Transcript_69212/m.130465 type:complete len:215 (+) Transcript_69212:172-816(+)